ncbi:MAG TPA: GNAT family N-acetyltransferase [Dehalococcoidia bacterium]|nr:GNAT family N-acetyltransferase [Dehalococcoidia bacterium]
MGRDEKVVPEVRPVTADRWADLEKLFSNRGLANSCFDMWFRRPRREYRREGREGNRKAMRAIVRRNEIPGLLAYADGRPVGWCSISPRDRYPSLERSPMLRGVDETPVWSIVCFYIHPEERDKRIAEALLGGAVSYAAERGAEVVEAYPRDAEDDRLPDNQSYTGPLSMFRKAGFKEVARFTPDHPIMRFNIADFLKVG